ncbi:MAG TPA: hypothetical protein EYH24_00155, partial [Thermococcus paralvinellae]|nr:hypothetical protein [Thermococcus paralvinellae]
MRKFFLLLMLVLLSLLTPAMAQEIYWVKEFKGKAYAVALAPNGDIIVAGITDSFGAGSNDVWVLRLDENGNVKWQKTYGGSGSDWAEAVTITPNGDIIVVGETRSFGVGGLDVWVLQLDENGNVKWQKTYGGTKSDWAWAVAITPNGDIIVAGITWSFGAGEDDFWVLRLDEEGNIKWQKTYGGWGVDLARAVAIAPDGDGVLGGDYVIRFNVDDAPLYEGDGWG